MYNSTDGVSHRKQETQDVQATPVKMTFEEKRRRRNTAKLIESFGEAMKLKVE